MQNDSPNRSPASGASSSYWRGKTAIVTGGSKGLGRSIAQALAASGANVVIAARPSQSLDATIQEFQSAGATALAVATDVMQQSEVDRLVESTTERFGRLDGLFHCVGQSDRREILATTPDDFERAISLNFLAAVRCTLAAAPHLLESRGHLVHIGSLASKSTTKYLGAYPASKAALGSYCQQLRLELGPRGLHVLLVCPGPIARDDAGTRYDATAGDLPPSARQAAGGVRLRAILPDRLAKRILHACQRRQAELIVPGKARLLFAISSLWPRLGDWLIEKNSRS